MKNFASGWERISVCQALPPSHRKPPPRTPHSPHLGTSHRFSSLLVQVINNFRLFEHFIYPLQSCCHDKGKKEKIQKYIFSRHAGNILNHVTQILYRHLVFMITELKWAAMFSVDIVKLTPYKDIKILLLILYKKLFQMSPCDSDSSPWLDIRRRNLLIIWFPIVPKRLPGSDNPF